MVEWNKRWSSPFPCCPEDTSSVSVKKTLIEKKLRQPGFTFSACEPFTKNKERIQKLKETGDSRDIYLKDLDKAYFQHDMAYGDFKNLTTITFIIFWDFLILYQIFLSPQVKQCAVITYKHVLYELPHELPNDLRLRILGN